jgi:hypothetical protein
MKSHIYPAGTPYKVIDKYPDGRVVERTMYTKGPVSRIYTVTNIYAEHTPEEEEEINRAVGEWKYNYRMRRYKEELAKKEEEKKKQKTNETA